MTATAVPEGKNMVDAVHDLGHEELLPLAFGFADDKSCVHRDPKLPLIGADDAMSEEEEDAYVATLRQWNGNCMYQSLTTARAAWRDGPVTYFHTTGDMTVPLGYQKAFVKGMKHAGVQVQRACVETGYCPNLTGLKEIAELLRRIANGKVLGGKGDAELTKSASTGDVEGAIQSVGATNA